MTYVLEFLNSDEIKNFFDDKGLKVLSYLLRKVLFSQPEMLPDQSDKNIQMTKEFLEQWIAQALNWKTIGAGNYPIDVFDENSKVGIDIKFISAKTDEQNNFLTSISNETSLAQNFANEGADLDILFNNEDYEDILDKWKTLLNRKFQKAIEDLELKEIYYYIFIRGSNAINLCVCKVNPNKINDLEVERGNNRSVFIKNFVDRRYGEVKIYKSKKRMELRTYPINIQNDNKFVVFDFNHIYKNKTIELRKLMEDETKFKEYILKEFETLFGDYIN